MMSASATLTVPSAPPAASLHAAGSWDSPSLPPPPLELRLLSPIACSVALMKLDPVRATTKLPQTSPATSSLELCSPSGASSALVTSKGVRPTVFLSPPVDACSVSAERLKMPSLAANPRKEEDEGRWPYDAPGWSNCCPSSSPSSDRRVPVTDRQVPVGICSAVAAAAACSQVQSLIEGVRTGTSPQTVPCFKDQGSEQMRVIFW